MAYWTASSRSSLRSSPLDELGLEPELGNDEGKLDAHGVPRLYDVAQVDALPKVAAKCLV